jgi:hypothetical protein
LLPDLQFYYGIDLLETIAGRGIPPSLVLLYVRRLPDDSMTHALMQGGTEWLGWGTDRHMMAALYDQLAMNTIISGNWKKGKVPEIETYPRPNSTETRTEQNNSDLLRSVWAQLMG